MFGLITILLSTLSSYSPYAYGETLYGYLPPATRYGYGVLRIYAFDTNTDVIIQNIENGDTISQGNISPYGDLSIFLNKEIPFKIYADHSVVGYISAYANSSPTYQMTFPPSKENKGKFFIVDLPPLYDVFPGPTTYLTIFSWESSSVNVISMNSGDTVWSGNIAPYSFTKLLLDEGKYLISSTGKVTPEIINKHDASAYIPDKDGDGSGNDFMFHIYSLNQDYGRYSFYEIYAFENTDVKVFNIDNPSNPQFYDSFSLNAGGHYVKTFNLYDNVFHIISTGKISVLAGSYQTDIGNDPSSHSIGDLYTSVPSLDGKGKEYMVGLHCANNYYYESGFYIGTFNNSANITISGQDSVWSFLLSQNDGIWIQQQSVGDEYYNIVSDKPVYVFTGSIGGDNDFDNIMTYLPGSSTPELYISANVWICPKVINLRSQGRWITGFIELPEEYSTEDINISTVRLEYNSHYVYADTLHYEINDHNGNGISDLMVKFDRSAVENILEIGVVELSIRGQLNDGEEFYGIDTVRVIDKGIHRRRQIMAMNITPNPTRGNNTQISLYTTSFTDIEKKKPSSSLIQNITIYDVSGRIIKDLPIQKMNRGYSTVWDGKDSYGNTVNPGIYFVRGITTEGVINKKLVVIK